MKRGAGRMPETALKHETGADAHIVPMRRQTIAVQVRALLRRDIIAGRAMLCRRTTVFPIECVIRGYISGSAWKEYAALGTLAGEKLPASGSSMVVCPRCATGVC